MVETLRLLWWNTGLCPPRRVLPNRDHLHAVATAITRVNELEPLDILLLGECDDSCGENIRTASLPDHFEFLALRGDNDTSKRNMGIFWNPERVKRPNYLLELETSGGKRRLVSIRIEIQLFDGTSITLFAVHWPSRLFEGPGTRIRGDMASSLRREIDQLLAISNEANVIVVGDFNDNPYDVSIEQYLRATRDHEQAIRYPELLYNPFWRFLVSKFDYKMGRKIISSSGTYRYNRARETHRWHVFDQVIVSSSFLGRKEWHLDEEATTVLDRSDLHGISLAPKRFFDHYPIVSVFEKDE